MANPTVTFFTTCKPFDGKTTVPQMNCLQSLIRMSSDVIVFGNDVGVADVCSELGLIHRPDVKCKFGVPRLDKMIKRAQKIAKNNILCYVNSDIIMRKVSRALRPIKLSEFLVVGHRYDIKQKKELKFERKWHKELRKRAKLGPPCALDYFIFTKGLWPTIPKFVVGYIAYDNWLIEDALKRGKYVIDATKRILAFHQVHKGRRPKRPGDLHNLALFAGNPNKPRGFITSAPWILTKEGIKRR